MEQKFEGLTPMPEGLPPKPASVATPGLTPMIAPPPIVVRLTPMEMRLAAFIATETNIIDITEGREPKAGQGNGVLWDSNINGRHGELAAAKALNRYYCGNLANKDESKNFGMPDVARVDVRTGAGDHSKLALYSYDYPKPRSLIIVCVTGVARPPIFKVWGWLTLDEAIKLGETPKSYSGSNGDRWLEVDKKHLHPMHTLPAGSLTQPDLMLEGQRGYVRWPDARRPQGF